MTGAAARIEIDSLSKQFGALDVFENVNLDIGEREIVSIVGPSGCGKTTLLRCIDGLAQPSAGEVRIGGVRVTEPPRGVAVVFQHFGLFPWKTVYENVAYGLRLAGASKQQIRESVPRHVELVGLEGFEKAYPYQLSGGMPGTPSVIVVSFCAVGAALAAVALAAMAATAARTTAMRSARPRWCTFMDDPPSW